MTGNDERGYAEAIAWVAEHAPGPRVVVGLEGTRSYGIGLARVLQAAGLTVVEIERPRRGERRRGKSDPIDAPLTALHALRLDADRLPTPRADGEVRRHPFCSALTGNSPQPRLGRSIACARCCLPAATLIERCTAAVSTRHPNTRSGAPRPAASPSPSAGSTEISAITSATSPSWSPSSRVMDAPSVHQVLALATGGCRSRDCAPSARSRSA
jgi:hypothetical protein